MSRQKQIGIGLILLGILLLLDQFYILPLTGKNLLALIALALGILLIKKSTKSDRHRGLLSGSFFLLWGILTLLFNYSAETMDRTLFLGNIFISLGLANLVYFIFSGINKSLNLLSFFLYSAIGGTMVAAYYDKIDVWRLQELVDTYWPVVLILFGVSILLDSYRNKNRADDAPESPSQTE